MLWKFLVNYEWSQSSQVVEGATLPKSTPLGKRGRQQPV